MSGFRTSDSFYVSDIDDFISISSIDYWNRREEEEVELRKEFEDIGEIDLLAGQSIPLLLSSGIEPGEWRWATHQAELELRDLQSWDELEGALVRGLLSLGRRYATFRYARWERLSRASALTATLPYGFRALLDQYLLGEGLQLRADQRAKVRTALYDAERLQDVTAYQRAGRVQAVIHELARESHPSGPQGLDRMRTRQILSLARLRFSTTELHLESFAQMRAMHERYRRERAAELAGAVDFQPPRGKRIRNWRLRHLHSLLFMYPRSMRRTFKRGLSQLDTSNSRRDRTVAVNELAIAHCSLLVLHRRARERHPTP